jgi:hypothetical protein
MYAGRKVFSTQGKKNKAKWLKIITQKYFAE